jgi:hypothetical protein
MSTFFHRTLLNMSSNWFSYFYMLYVYRLWTILVGKFPTIFRGLKGNRVLYGNSFESDDTEDFPKEFKPNKYDQTSFLCCIVM